MQLKPGTRLRSAVCSTEVIVVRAPSDTFDLKCGGAPMLEMPADPSGAAVDAQHASGTVLGKRYTDAEGALELLCTKGGDGSLSIADVALGQKDAKPLPSSD